MQRTSTMTFTASAVTLACLAASLYASPQVLADPTGREFHAFSPLDQQPFAHDREQSTGSTAGAAKTSREESVRTNDGSWQVVDAETNTASAALTNDDDDGSNLEIVTDEAVNSEVAADAQNAITDDVPSTEPSDASTSPSISGLPQIEVTLPEIEASQEPATPDTAQDTQDELPEDLESPDSLTVIVNKLRALPADYIPEDLVDLPPSFGEGHHQLREEASEAALELFEAAEADGIDLTIISSYRSYDYQHELYGNYVRQHGPDNTNEMSARPGHSEHQTGLALDVDTPDGQHTLATSFGATEAGQWLVEHAHEYGFVIRYPEEHQDITGFQYEPWHLRYFTEQYANQIVENSGVAETEFGLDPAPDYED